MPFFSELYDSVRNTPEESALASALLKLQALHSEPCYLSTTHAIDARYLLDDCARSKYFCNLVETGKIRFKRWPDGTGPREALKKMLGQPAYVHSGWPEFNLPERSDAEREEIRTCVKAILTAGRGYTEIETLDARIERARALFSAIDEFGCDEREEKRGPILAEGMKRAGEGVPPGEEYSDLRNLLALIGNYGERHSRSHVYGKIGQWARSREAEDRAKDIIDGIYNQAVAKSLNQPFHSARRVFQELGSEFHGHEAERCDIQVVKPISDDELKDFSNLSIEWKDVHEALNSNNVGSSSREIAVGKLASILAGRSQTVRFAEFAIPTIFASVALQVVFNGALEAWMISVLAPLAGAAVYTKFPQVNTLHTRELNNRLSGWLDKV